LGERAILVGKEMVKTVGKAMDQFPNLFIFEPTKRGKVSGCV
jgi:hypothetical protein